MNVVLKAVLILRVVFADQEYDGSYNYFLEQIDGAYSKRYAISHSYPVDMNLKSGDTIQAYVDGLCEDAWSLKESPKSMEEIYPWGIPSKTYICNANFLIIDNVKYTTLVR